MTRRHAGGQRHHQMGWIVLWLSRNRLLCLLMALWSIGRAGMAVKVAKCLISIDALERLYYTYIE
jgi:hypothetical protein